MVSGGAARVPWLPLAFQCRLVGSESAACSSIALLFLRAAPCPAHNTRTGYEYPLLAGTVSRVSHWRTQHGGLNSATCVDADERLLTGYRRTLTAPSDPTHHLLSRTLAHSHSHSRTSPSAQHPAVTQSTVQCSASTGGPAYPFLVTAGTRCVSGECESQEPD